MSDKKIHIKSDKDKLIFFNDDETLLIIDIGKDIENGEFLMWYKLKRILANKNKMSEELQKEVGRLIKILIDNFVTCIADLMSLDVEEIITFTEGLNRIEKEWKEEEKKRENDRYLEFQRKMNQIELK